MTKVMATMILTNDSATVMVVWGDRNGRHINVAG